MKVLISVDMEGVAGVATPRQVVPDRVDYPVGRALMTEEANAAVAGALDGGATDVLVNDSHGPMDNLIGEQLDPRASYVVGSPKPLVMMEGLEQSTGVALLVGYHAGPDETVGVLAHTYSGAAFAGLQLDGEPLTELWLNTLLAASYGVPVGLVTGDDAICRLAEKLLPGVVTVPVKTALGYSAARSLHPQAARAAIRQGAAEAVRRAGSLDVPWVPAEQVLEVELRHVMAAEAVARVPGTERRGPRTVRRSVQGPRELLDVLDVWARLAASAQP
jgi:D-amino peptidase